MNRSAPTPRTGRPAVRCAIYTRKSTDEGLDQEFNSLDAQRESCEAFVRSQAQEGWVVLPARYDDGGFTGGNMDRPALKRLLDDVGEGRIDCVIIYKVDRLSRSLLDFARLIETFEQRNVAFVSITQQFNSATSMGRLVLNVLLSFAQFEREIIGERIRDKIAATRKKGKWGGGAPVLGYDVDRAGGGRRLVVNAAEAARVREIFRLYLELGALLPVVAELKNRDWRNKATVSRKQRVRGGRNFDNCSLRSLLRNPIYVGMVKHRTDFYPGEHEPIVDRATFDRVAAKMTQNAVACGALVRNRYGALLRGIAFCKGCDRAMVHTYTAKGTKRYRYYTCTKAIKEGRRACRSPSLPAETFEQFVVGEVRGVLADPGLRRDVMRRAADEVGRELADRVAERDGLTRELRRHHGEIRTLAIGSADPARLADLHEKVRVAESRIAVLEKEIADRTGSAPGPADIGRVLDDFDGAWEALAPRERVELLQTLVARVEYDPDASQIAVTFHPAALRSPTSGGVPC
ncbi:MAG: recombinase family protein [Fimbriiglobus sp.]